MRSALPLYHCYSTGHGRETNQICLQLTFRLTSLVYFLRRRSTCYSTTPIRPPSTPEDFVYTVDQIFKSGVEMLIFSVNLEVTTALSLYQPE